MGLFECQSGSDNCLEIEKIICFHVLRYLIISGDLVVCLGKEPWTDYCLEPPCGQMNVVNQGLYPVLKVRFVTERLLLLLTYLTRHRIDYDLSKI